MNDSIYFFCFPLGPPERAGYQHQLISIAEGLRELNISFYSNINYWNLDPINQNYLFLNDNSIDYRDCAAVVFSSTMFNYDSMHLLPNDLFNDERTYKIIFIDDSDGFITPGFNLYKKVDIVLKSHYNKKYKYPENFRPWQFGLTNRIIDALNPKPFQERKKEVLVNFRVSHKLRDQAERDIMPVISKFLKENDETDSIEDNKLIEDQLNWHQTGRRHYSSFYQRLSNSAACACFGGEFQNALSNKEGRAAYYLRQLNNKINLIKPDRVLQFDSWRFWESLAAGCCVLQVDLNKYGIKLPVMPANNRHYIGVDFNNTSSLNKVFSNEKILEDISESGKEWALKYYSPKQTAIRFLDLLI
jgi:hypothetical protein